ncbi:MAG: FecR domain-containing protein [Candidatus Hydrogenedentota bacterium]
MASCAQVEALIQAYLDGELEASGQVILDRHVAECASCARKVRQQQAAAAELFEALRSERLTQDLQEVVLAHLPEMERPPQDMSDINWRAKHPSASLARWGRRVPAMVAVMLLLTAALVKVYWPEPPLPAYSVGVVLQSMGRVTTFDSASTERSPVPVAEGVLAERSYETGANARLMLALAGQTRIKLNQQSRIRVEDERRVRLEQGEIWMDVGHDGRLFRVTVPDGVVTVFGTAFAINVDRDQTTVSVEEGHVQVENSEGFRLVHPNEQVRWAAGEEPPLAQKADIGPVTAWAQAIVPDSEAENVYQAQLAASSERPTELAAKEVFLIDVMQGGRRWDISSLRISWDGPLPPDQTYSGYEVYVYDQDMQPVTKEEVDGNMFTNARNAGDEYIDLPLENKVHDGIKMLTVRLAPTQEDALTAPDLEVSALAS